MAPIELKELKDQLQEICWNGGLFARVYRHEVHPVLLSMRRTRPVCPRSQNLETLSLWMANQYHPGKANVVADALSRKSGMIAGIKVEEEIICDLERLDIELCVRGQNGFWASLRVEPNLISQIKTAQKDDREIWAIIQNIDQQTEFRVDDDGILWQGTKLCVPEDPTLREALMTEAHSSPFSIHPGSTKMYHDLKQHFWWSGMKRDDDVSMDIVTGNHGLREATMLSGLLTDRLTKSAPVYKDASGTLCSSDMYGYCKYHKKKAKTGQGRTRERIKCTRAGSFLANGQQSQP
ncbi:retrotransposon protein, putative, ty3-gypsy subclass [Tanacetum coccineum]